MKDWQYGTTFSRVDKLAQVASVGKSRLDIYMNLMSVPRRRRRPSFRLSVTDDTDSYKIWFVHHTPVGHR